MVDIYRASNFEELEAARLGEPEKPKAQTKDVKAEQVEEG